MTGSVNSQVYMCTCIRFRAMQEMTVQYYPFASVRPVSPVSVAASSMTNSETGEPNKVKCINCYQATEREDMIK